MTMNLLHYLKKMFSTTGGILWFLIVLVIGACVFGFLYQFFGVLTFFVVLFTGAGIQIYRETKKRIESLEDSLERYQERVQYLSSQVRILEEKLSTNGIQFYPCDWRW